MHLSHDLLSAPHLNWTRSEISFHDAYHEALLAPHLHHGSQCCRSRLHQPHRRGAGRVVLQRHHQHPFDRLRCLGQRSHLQPRRLPHLQHQHESNSGTDLQRDIVPELQRGRRRHRRRRLGLLRRRGVWSADDAGRAVDPGRPQLLLLRRRRRGAVREGDEVRDHGEAGKWPATVPQPAAAAAAAAGRRPRSADFAGGAGGRWRRRREWGQEERIWSGFLRICCVNVQFISFNLRKIN